MFVHFLFLIFSQISESLIFGTKVYHYNAGKIELVQLRRTFVAGWTEKISGRYEL